MFVQLKSDHVGHKAGERLEVPDAHAQALIQAGIAEAVAGDPIGELVSKSLVAQFEALNKGLESAINTALEQFQKSQHLSRKNAVPAIFGEGGFGDPERCFGDWALCVATMGSVKATHTAKNKAAEKLEKVYGSMLKEWSPETQARMKAALSESSGVTGGYTVPPDFYDKLMLVVAETAIMRNQGAFVMPMASATFQMPYLDLTTAQAAGTSPFFGGIKFNWTAEAQNRTETEPKFKLFELKAWELSGYTVSSNVLLADAAFGLEKFLFFLFGTGISWYEDYAFLQGTGAGQPQGVLTANCAISVNRQTANKVQFADVANLQSKLLPSSYGKAIWTFSPSVVPQLLQLQDGANRAIFISIDQGITKKPTWSLLGRPCIPTEKVPALGTKGDLMLIDPSLYIIGDRQQIEIAASEHVNFLANQMTWRVVERVDGRPWMDQPVTLQDGATQVSPIVVLN
jgi:HK97 family phage major capsid protein